jgi:UDP-3-O-[3-hydroxymyristoyl] glucosamine N-acyltransferase
MGTLNDTWIQQNTRIVPLTCIGHGVKIGKSCFISQGVTIAGSSIIGDYSKIWGNSSIYDSIKVGQNCVIGMGAVITKYIPNGEVWVGNPAKKTKE